jgi:hypothetical protein
VAETGERYRHSVDDLLIANSFFAHLGDLLIARVGRQNENRPMGQEVEE